MFLSVNAKSSARSPIIENDENRVIPITKWAEIGKLSGLAYRTRIVTMLTVDTTVKKLVF